MTTSDFLLSNIFFGLLYDDNLNEDLSICHPIIVDIDLISFFLLSTGGPVRALSIYRSSF